MNTCPYMIDDQLILGVCTLVSPPRSSPPTKHQSLSNSSVPINSGGKGRTRRRVCELSVHVTFLSTLKAEVPPMHDSHVDVVAKRFPKMTKQLIFTTLSTVLGRYVEELRDLICQYCSPCEFDCT